MKNTFQPPFWKKKLRKLQGIPAFRDFTIRDPRYFVILFEAKIHDFEEKNLKKKSEKK